MAESVLVAEGLTRLFADEAGVRDVDLDVREGDIHALVGLNGAGKSTLMRLLVGMLRPQSGTVRLAGHELGSAPRSLWSTVGHLVEYPLAYPELSTRANLSLGARLHGVPPRDVARVVGSVLDEFALGGYAARRATRLSLGNRQRLGLASALQHDPTLIVLDEPTNALDPRGVILLRESLRRRADAGAAVLVSSHHLDEVARIADRITVVNAGRVVGGLDPRSVDIERHFFDLVLADDLARS